MGFLSGLVDFIGFAVEEMIDSAAKRGNATYKGTARQGEWEAKRDAGLNAAHTFHDKMSGYSHKIEEWENKKKH